MQNAKCKMQNETNRVIARTLSEAEGDVAIPR